MSSLKRTMTLFTARKQNLSEKKNVATKNLQLTPIFVGLEIHCFKKTFLGFMWKFLSHVGTIMYLETVHSFSGHPDLNNHPETILISALFG